MADATYAVTFAPQEGKTVPAGHSALVVEMCQTCWCLVPQAVVAEHMQEVHQIGSGYVPEGPPTATPTS